MVHRGLAVDVLPAIGEKQPVECAIDPWRIESCVDLASGERTAESDLVGSEAAVVLLPDIERRKMLRGIRFRSEEHTSELQSP